MVVVSFLESLDSVILIQQYLIIFLLHVQNSLQAYVRLLSQERWKGIDHSIIQHHVPFLGDFTFDELMVAVERHKVWHIFSVFVAKFLISSNI